MGQAPLPRTGPGVTAMWRRTERPVWVRITGRALLALADKASWYGAVPPPKAAEASVSDRG